jgi:threonine dehydratase
VEQFEQVNSFKYLGSTVNTDNSIEEEIKERIVAGSSRKKGIPCS